MMDITEIKSILPHRYPFLLVDRVTEMKTGESIVAYKNVTANEEFFQGHFPLKPVMPGVLIVEAMAQACGVLAFKSGDAELNGNQIVLLAGVDKVRFKRPVEPGDKLVLEGKVDKVRRGMWIFSATASVDGDKAAQAEIICTLKEV